MKIEEAITLFRNYLKNITAFNADEFDLALPYFVIRELRKGEHFVAENKTCTHFAFMISGPATSLGVIGGLNIIMKRRAIFLYIFFILTGSIILGYDALLNL